MTPDQLRQQIELSIVEFIKKALAAGSMTEERAQQISQVVLDTVKPGMDFDQLYRAIPKLDDSCQEISPIILPFLKQYEDNVNKKGLEEVTRLIKLGQYDAAADLGKRIVNQEVELVWQGSAKPDRSPEPAEGQGSGRAAAEKADDGGLKTEDGQQKTDDGQQPAEDQMVDVGSSKLETGNSNTNQKSDTSSFQSPASIVQPPASNIQPQISANNNSVLPDPLSVTPMGNDVMNVVTPMPTASQMIPADDLLPNPFDTTPLV
jgi:hypothetical protein